MIIQQKSSRKTLLLWIFSWWWTTLTMMTTQANQAGRTSFNSASMSRIIHTLRLYSAGDERGRLLQRTHEHQYGHTLHALMHFRALTLIKIDRTTVHVRVDTSYSWNMGEKWTFTTTILDSIVGTFCHKISTLLHFWGLTVYFFLPLKSALKMYFYHAGWELVRSQSDL